MSLIQSVYGINKLIFVKTKTTEEFIKEAKEIHGDKYDYSETVYTGCFEKIKIICPEHGIFFTNPGTHLNGKGGCKKCAKKYQAINKKDLKWFIRRAKEIHGDKYDYSLIKNFDTTHSKYKFICPIHGIFEQVGYSHLSGCGCKKCANDYQSNLKKKTTEEFIEEAKKIHGDKYDYSLVEYKGCFEKIKIICPEHGTFLQIPSAHLQKEGCPFCTFKNQTKIAESLKKRNLFFKTEQKFEDLKDKYFLKYDFYIPSKNLLIEYDGIQHYTFPNYFHKTYHDFLVQKHHDWLKRKYAKEHNIRLERILYNENIESRLDEILF